jgi:thioredoxin
MATLELNTDNFQQTINENANVIIDFWAPWCAPCRGFAPTFEAAVGKAAGIVFAKVNTEEQQEIAAAFNIRSIPTLMIFRDQIIIYSEAGALPASRLRATHRAGHGAGHGSGAPGNRQQRGSKLSRAPRIRHDTDGEYAVSTMPEKISRIDRRLVFCQLAPAF